MSSTFSNSDDEQLAVLFYVVRIFSASPVFDRFTKISCSCSRPLSLWRRWGNYVPLYGFVCLFFSNSRPCAIVRNWIKSLFGWRQFWSQFFVNKHRGAWTSFLLVIRECFSVNNVKYFCRLARRKILRTLFTERNAPNDLSRNFQYANEEFPLSSIVQVPDLILGLLLKYSHWIKGCLVTVKISC